MTFVLQSFLGLSGVRDALDGNKVTMVLLEAGYNVTAENPVLVNMAPTATPTKSQPNPSMIAAITVGVIAFVVILMSFVYFFRVMKKVCYLLFTYIYIFKSIYKNIIQYFILSQKTLVPKIPWSALEFPNGVVDELVLGEGSFGLVLKAVWYPSQTNGRDGGRRISSFRGV